MDKGTYKEKHKQVCGKGKKNELQYTVTIMASAILAASGVGVWHQCVA